jgi:hypothetical protein
VFPGFVPPCLPTKAKEPPRGNAWLHEIKHDGFRVIAARTGHGLSSTAATAATSPIVSYRSSRPWSGCARAPVSLMALPSGYLNLRPEAKIGQRLIAKLFWIALARFRGFDNLPGDRLGCEIILI